jgi:hypothetical protein
MLGFILFFGGALVFNCRKACAADSTDVDGCYAGLLKGFGVSGLDACTCFLD